MDRNDYREILQRYWGYEDFRGIQWDIIHSITQGKDTLGLMPTGGGKSITFQVPALSMPGICIVITPLIALMKDQVQNLRRRGIKAASVHAGMHHQEILTTLENCIFGDYKFLYVSPERLASPIFQTKLRHMQVSFITVDEAHCISQWGYDFRPSYLQIAQARQLVPHAPVLALTATATPDVIQDIQRQLAFSQENVFRMSYERKNLHYIVRYADQIMPVIRHTLNSVPGSSIIYTFSRDKCAEVAKMLTEEGFNATYYHAGLRNVDKDERQKSWQRGDTRIMVATNAFGMGIDKPDVRTVIHVDFPNSIEAYFQEAGRAGRDGKDAYAVLIHTHGASMVLNRRCSISFPPKEYILQVYEQLCYFLQIAMGDGLHVRREFSLVEFCRVNHFNMARTDSALHLLAQAGYIDYTEPEENISRIVIKATRRELYSAVATGSMTEMIVNYILRHHTAVFVEYVYIDEEAIARALNTNFRTIYQALSQLSKQHIVDYVPRKNCQYITFLTRRDDTRHMVIPRAVYEDRKESLERHINAMRRYYEQLDTCRSQYLLQYFGEEDAPECGHCDVCRETGIPVLTEELYQAIRARIRQVLADGVHPAEDMTVPGFRLNDIQRAIRRMRDEEEIIPVNDIFVRLSQE